MRDIFKKIIPLVPHPTSINYYLLLMPQSFNRSNFSCSSGRIPSSSYNCNYYTSNKTTCAMISDILTKIPIYCGVSITDISITIIIPSSFLFIINSIVVRILLLYIIAFTQQFLTINYVLFLFPFLFLCCYSQYLFVYESDRDPKSSIQR